MCWQGMRASRGIPNFRGHSWWHWERTLNISTAPAFWRVPSKASFALSLNKLKSATISASVGRGVHHRTKEGHTKLLLLETGPPCISVAVVSLAPGEELLEDRHEILAGELHLAAPRTVREFFLTHLGCTMCLRSCRRSEIFLSPGPPVDSSELVAGHSLLFHSSVPGCSCLAVPAGSASGRLPCPTLPLPVIGNDHVWARGVRHCKLGLGPPTATNCWQGSGGFPS